MKKLILGVALFSVLLLGMSPVRVNTTFVVGDGGFLDTEHKVYVKTVAHDNHELIITVVFATESCAISTIHKPNCSFCKGKAEK